MALGRFFFWFGSKTRSAKHYPKPLHETVIEPFAGSASYAVRYYDRRVVLVDKDPTIVALWRYLIRVRPAELLALPDLPDGGTIADLAVCEEARLLISYSVNRGTGGNGKKLSAWDRAAPHSSWGRTRRALLAAQVGKIRHWQIIEGSYEQAPDVEATWFVDPPYEGALGTLYRESVTALDLPSLGTWCRSRRGQTIVCENEGATWLPFKPFRVIQATIRRSGHPEDGISREAIWTNDAEAPATT